MLYNLIKIFHIVTATLLLTTMAYCYYVWLGKDKGRDIKQIQSLTLQIIAPAALLQLVTGFMMTSLKPEILSQFWIKASSFGFVLVIASWFAFIYFLLSDNRKVQSLMLIGNFLGLLAMIFFMVSKI